MTAAQCSKEPNCVPQCTSKECDFLCRHQISCIYLLGLPGGSLVQTLSQSSLISRSTDQMLILGHNHFLSPPNHILQTDQVCFIALSDDSCKTMIAE